MDGFDNHENRVWGPWATAGFGLAVGAAFILVQIVVAIFFVAAKVTSLSKQESLDFIRNLATNGLYFAFSTFSTSIICVGLIFLFIELRKDTRVKAYLAFVPISPNTLWNLAGATAGFMLVSGGLTFFLHQPSIPPFLIDAYRTSLFPPLLWATVILAAPAFEEVFFRGFLLEGFRRSRMGNGGAAIFTSLLWAAIHLQYDFYEMATIFALGLLLAAARFKTGSIWSCLFIHAFFNFIAMVELALYVNPL